MKKASSGFRTGILSLILSLFLVLSLSGQALAAVHNVISGDTLWKIGIRYGTTVDRLMKANNLRGTTIFPGQQLYIPDRNNPGETIASRGSSPGEIPASEFDLLARIITAEADNQDYATMVAVGSVVINRVKSPLFPDSIRGVVYQVDEGGRYQFEPVLNGWINRPASEAAKKAARDALNGVDPTGGALFFWESWVKNKFLNSRPLARVMGEFTFTY